MTPEERERMLARRKFEGNPFHSPPHRWNGFRTYHLSAACFEHQPIIGQSPTRMAEFEHDLLELLGKLTHEIFAWCILPNHYHVLIQPEDLRITVAALGRFHGGKSFKWNGEEQMRGRQVWFRSSDRGIRSARHFWVTMNYVHHNPVKHGYVKKWQEWPYSSAKQFLEAAGKELAEKIWREYPVRDYGKGWDED